MARALQPLKSGSLRDQARERIFDSIVSGRFRPGDPLRELDLARSLRVSQATVRDALMQLEPTGLIVRVPNKETIVTRLSQQELRDRKWIRVLLEPEAGVEAARVMTPADHQELSRRLQAINKAITKNAYFELAQADLEFHRFIWKAANPTVFRVLDNLTAPMFAFVQILRSYGHEDLKPGVRAHEPIVEAIKQNEPDRIRVAIREHIENSYQEYLDPEWENFEVLVKSRARLAGASK
jgi:DNA-binding GntR family transcriptional regulator